MVEESVEEGAMVYTDQNVSYKGLTKKNYKHQAVNHSVGEYIKGQAHTNGVESIGLCSSVHMGVYHQMSPKHLQRYLVGRQRKTA